MTYIDPKTVDSPRANWKLIEVLRNGSNDKDGDGDAALAIGEWNSHDGSGSTRVLAVRWNGNSASLSGVGNPQSRGLPTWFILPQWMNEAIIDSSVIPDAKKALVKALMNQ